MKFGVVVLNYNDYHSTLRCVKSILACSPEPELIAVVDNHSPNKSYDVLRKSLSKYNLIEVLDSGRNGGYSFGNNYGIRRLMQAGVDHVVIATSDTEVVSGDIFWQFENMIGADVGLVGPRIFTSCGEQNPSTEQLSLKYIADLLWVQYGMPGREFRRHLALLFNILKTISFKKSLSERCHLNGKQLSYRRVYRLHGSFLCLTKFFLERVGYLDERIFMFGEEDLLAWQCEKTGLHRLLAETVIVNHFDDSSINATWGQDAKEFVCITQRESGRILREEISVIRLVWKWICQRLLSSN